MDIFFGRKKVSELDILESPNEPTLPDSSENQTEETSTMHFAVKSKLGWVAWLDRESSLYSLFERSFAATRCELKMSEMLDEYALEVEIPNSFVDKFTKYFNGKALALEIDKLHGLEPTLSRWRDVKLSGLKKTLGTTSTSSTTRSSLEALQKRFQNLENCSDQRQKEVEALKELIKSLKKDMNKRLDDITQRIDIKVYEACGRKFDIIEQRILATVREELSFVMLKLPFKHPPEGYVAPSLIINSPGASTPGDLEFLTKPPPASRQQSSELHIEGDLGDLKSSASKGRTQSNSRRTPKIRHQQSPTIFDSESKDELYTKLRKISFHKPDDDMDGDSFDEESKVKRNQTKKHTTKKKYHLHAPKNDDASKPQTEDIMPRNESTATTDERVTEEKPLVLEIKDLMDQQDV